LKRVLIRGLLSLAILGITLTVSVIWDKMVYTIPVLAVLMFFAAVIEKDPTPRQLDEGSDGDEVDHEMCPLSLMLASVLHASSAGASGILNMFAHQGMVLEGGPDLCKAVSQVTSNQKGLLLLASTHFIPVHRPKRFEVADMGIRDSAPSRDWPIDTDRCTALNEATQTTIDEA